MRKIDRARILIAIAVVAGGVVASACSPEASRTRGDGPGADVGNRQLGPSIDLHGQTNPMFDTPVSGMASKESQ